MKSFNDVLDARAKGALVWLLLAAFAAASACGGGGARQAGDEATSAREAFRRYCAACHGPEGEGRQLGASPVPSFKSDSVVKLTDEQLYYWIANGDSNMPSFRNTLTEEQMRTLVKHVRYLQKQ